MHRTVQAAATAIFGLWSTLACADNPAAIVFGQLELEGGGAVPADWKLVVRNVDTKETATIALEKRERGISLYDFATPLPPGKYHFHTIEAPNVDWPNRVAPPEQYFELRPAAVLYLGYWKVKLGVGRTKTTYTVKYDLDEVGLFAKANPRLEPSRFAIGVLGKPPVPLTTQ